MKKKYLFLGLSLLFCGGSMFADDDSVNNGVKEVSSFGELVSALQSSVQKAEAQTKVDELVSESIAHKRQEALIQQYETISKDIDYVDPVYTAVNNYVKAVEGTNATGYEATISYRILAKKGWMDEEASYELYVTTPELTAAVDSALSLSGSLEDESYIVWVDKEWKVISAEKAVSLLGDQSAAKDYKFGNLPSTVMLAYKRRLYDTDRSGKYSEIYETGNQSVTTNRSYVFATGIVNALKGLLTSQSSNMSFRTTIEKQQETANYINWVAQGKTLESELAAAREAYDAIAVYNNLKVVGDITVDGTDRSSLKVPAGCTIDGGFNHVNGVGTGDEALFAANEGTIKNWISENGSIAMVNTGFVNNCIVKNSAGKFAVYTDNVSTTFDDIVTAVYQNREVYGYDLTNKTVTASSANKLYQAGYASAADKTEKSFYVNVNGTDITDGNNLGAYNRENAFIYIKDADVPAITTTNVVANGVCENAEIVEGGKAEFYIPANFTAKNLSYARSLNSDVATVCLPFALTEELQASINEKLGDGNQMYYYTCNSIDENTNTVWFGLKTAVDANTPSILAFTQGCKPGNIFDGLENVDFVSTVGADLAVIPSAGNDQAKRFRGNYKAGQSLAMLTEVAGGIGGYVYGFKDGRLVKLADKAIVNQFRSFVVYDKDLTQNNQSANGELRARFVDMDGNEMMPTAIEKVSKDNAGDFKVVGGNGAIEVSTSKACDVKIYTVGGSLVNTVRVEAGNTTLPLNAGLYIVNKNKVVVK